ncbi:MAG TPA: ferritin-like domain-containing protein, partial [Opitutus sp.]|nr:ferritin-like domain-containing protein [Opitutus sp.]
MNNELSPEAREQVGSILNHALADEFALSAATRDYHWNVTGPHFRSLHELFDEQYHQIDALIEKLGERARVIGVVAQTGWTELINAPRFTPSRGADLSAR